MECGFVLYQNGERMTLLKEYARYYMNDRSNTHQQHINSNSGGEASNVSTIHIYTDGACSGNPGPAGAGVLLMYKDKKKEISEYLGHGTNNIAELTAIKLGLGAIKPNALALPIKVYTDSQYAIGILCHGWTPKKNIELIEEIKAQLRTFRDVIFIKVKGHSDDEGNQIVDKLAVDAYKRHK